MFCEGNLSVQKYLTHGMFRFASGIPPIGDHFEQEIELLAPCINGESVNPQLLYKRIYGADKDFSTIEITQKTLFV